jgi:hypothetical protein
LEIVQFWGCYQRRQQTWALLAPRLRAKEEEEEGEKDPLKQPVVAYLTNAGLLPEVAATIADYVRNEFEADIAQDLAVLDQV